MDSSTTLNSASPEIADVKDDVDREEEPAVQPFPAHEVRKRDLKCDSGS
jgi:hypothetical protein